MALNLIDVINKAIPEAVDTGDEVYEAWIGSEDFTPEVTITTSDDINCGAICNELEFVRLALDYHTQSFDLDVAEDVNLEALIQAIIDLPRNNDAETDAAYRRRFRFIVNQKSNVRRTTRSAIVDAISYFITDTTKVQIVELFDTNGHYFQLRLEGVNSYVDALFLDSDTYGFLDYNYIGGPGVGGVVSFIGDLIDRIRAVGVDFDVLFINQSSVTKTSDAVVGVVQIYKTCDATVQVVRTLTKTSDAVVV